MVSQRLNSRREFSLPFFKEHGSSSDNDEVDIVLDEKSKERREIRHEALTEPAFRSSAASRWSSHNFRNRCSTVSFKFSLSSVRSISRLYASITGSA